jgi:tetratricopeptide (TPR) repeat protein
MLKKGKFSVFKIWLVCLLLASISNCVLAQLSIPRSYEEQIYAEGKELYDDATYGHARDRFEAFLSIPADDRSPAWQSHQVSAKLYAALCSFWLEEDQAEHALVRLIYAYRPDPLVYIAAKEVGNKYYNKKRYREAISYYDLVELDKVDQDLRAEVAFKKGYCHFVRKEFDLAANHLTQAAAFRTIYYFPSNYYLGMTSFFKEDYDRAGHYFEKVSPSQTYKTYVPYYLTQIYFSQGKYQQVVAYGNRQLNTIEVQKSAEIKNLIGRSYYELGDETNALKFLREIEKSEIDFTTSDHYQMGYLSYKEAAYDDAILHLKDVASLNDETGHQANYYLAHAYLNKGNKEAARSAFANVKRRTENQALKDEAAYNYGLLSAELNHDREAVNALMEINAGSTYYASAQEALAKLFLRTNDYDNAITILNDLDKSNPILKEAYQKVTFYKAKQLIQANDFPGALTLMDKSLSYAVDANIHAETQYTKGITLHKLKRYGESITSLNAHKTLQANRQDETTYIAPYIQGYNYLKQNKYAEAKAHFAAAVEQIDQNKNSITSTYILTNILSDALVRLGDCEFHFNNYDAAQTKYNRAYQMTSSSYIYAYYQSGIIYGLKGDPIQQIVILEDLHKQYPTSALADDALAESSRTYLTLGKYDQAATPLLALVDEYPQSDLLTPSYLMLGLISYNKGATEQAVTFYKKVFKYNPSPTERQDALEALQEIYINDLKDPDEYLAFIANISGGKIEDGVRDSLNYKTAYRSYVNGDYQTAAQGLSKYLTNFSDGIYHVEAHYFRGECAAIEKDYSNAYRDYTYVVDQGPGQYYEKSLRKSALISYNELRNFEKAYEYFNRWSELNIAANQKIEAWLGAMRSAHRIGKRDETLRLGQLIQDHPESTSSDRLATDYYLARILYDDNRMNEALLPLNRLSKQSQDEFAAEARYLIANIYTQRKEFKIAEEMCRLAIKENTNYPYWVAKSIILLSDVLVAQGDKFNAKAALEAVIDNFTEDVVLVNVARSKLKIIESSEPTETQNIGNSNKDLIQLEDE